MLVSGVIADLPNIDTFHYTISKSHLSTPPMRLEESLRIQASSLWRGIQDFQNSNFCLKVWILSLVTNIIVFLEVTGLVLIKGLPQGSPTCGLWTGTGPWPVRNQPHGRRKQQASVRSFICRSPSLALLPEPSPPTPRRSVENCLPRNWSLVPKRLGTAGLPNSQV